MFVIQRVLESEGNFTLLDKNKVLQQHDLFRIFATTNTVGLGDTTGLYHGTQQINQGQMDRWNIVSTLNYLPFEKELEIVLAKNKNFNHKEGKELLSNMIKVADLTRKVLSMVISQLLWVLEQFYIGPKIQVYSKTKDTLLELPS